jgi:hypothetical protein
MKRCIASVTMMGVLILQAAVAQSTAAEPRREAQNAQADELKALQEERIEALTKLVGMMTEQYRQGVRDIDAVLSARSRLIEAQLDATEGPEAKVALLTEQLADAATLLKVSEEMARTGRKSQADVFLAKSLHLDVKIKLLRERRKCKISTPQPDIRDEKTSRANVPPAPPPPAPIAPRP